MSSKLFTSNLRLLSVPLLQQAVFPVEVAVATAAAGMLVLDAFAAELPAVQDDALISGTAACFIHLLVIQPLKLMV